MQKLTDFKQKTVRFDYDPEKNELYQSSDPTAVQTKYFNSEGNRQRLISYDKDHVKHSITWDYNNHFKVESYSNGKCKKRNYDIDFSLKEQFAYFYDPEAGKLQYLGLIECPWDHNTLHYGFQENLQSGTHQNIYYYGTEEGQLRWIYRKSDDKPQVVYILSME